MFPRGRVSLPREARTFVGVSEMLVAASEQERLIAAMGPFCLVIQARR
jgi:hypothetical protein